MHDATPSLASDTPRTAALIVAAGKGLRAGGDVPKQFADYDGKPLLRHSVEAFARWQSAPLIVVVIGEGQDAMARAALGELDGIALVTGGAERSDSVRLGLLAIAALGGIDRVFIHDAARPALSSDVLDRLNAALDHHQGAVPVLPVVDSIARGADGVMEQAVDRAQLWRIQTPQAFRFDAILTAHLGWPSDQAATDDSQIARAHGLGVALVEGDEALTKITFAKDLAVPHSPVPMPAPMIARTGMGYDVHRLVVGEELWLGGIKIAHDKGLAGHSDADVALHAITDALLGAMALGDIGEHFPPSDPQWRGADSARFLAHAASLVRAKGGVIANIDLTIICEEPKIGPHKASIQQRIATLLDLRPDQVGVKATTTERLGFTGRGEGIAAQAAASIMVADTF
ncbi:bifunctional 2-C-methyl-D-erythritol 4-phosphate cytidylyltransferase/2-C-methyl-D-erythritol 2,4-cyclodiphosphate synthase [Blastomonas sp.]|uniref:bifunctional 2-C-methyl-D-erythritol 4-phosphate cytidylyltransferase/2-C-methyl-D-erythritol 2,4-cyclodiphosphate synthase n=1 Tax=Blastomonas sp. TaxID=1909299 RepID=UPI00261661F1|nr:bifunctional 2-C-methyl-D-erythritol 4-phosphate cytidylyltransferase/2-C-methyl-D-erythritol 2,4-cyclodiphosphate synthase [Blastomonas sp.]MDM7957198.1 bifunctional 2-C-methyl-D-erythritol 4-phosphate cytidylyltransferase/2-C-methyl-D-erythritol 2,4-cyclodiphosphate synthase [Blastomonas sp.]